MKNKEMLEGESGMSDELEKPKRQKLGWGGKREGAGRKPGVFKQLRVHLTLRDYEYEALHFLCLDRGVNFSRCAGDLIMQAYRERVHKVTKGE